MNKPLGTEDRPERKGQRGSSSIAHMHTHKADSHIPSIKQSTHCWWPWCCLAPSQVCVCVSFKDVTDMLDWTFGSMHKDSNCRCASLLPAVLPGTSRWQGERARNKRDTNKQRVLYNEWFPSLASLISLWDEGCGQSQHIQHCCKQVVAVLLHSVNVCGEQCVWF